MPLKGGHSCDRMRPESKNGGRKSPENCRFRPLARFWRAAIAWRDGESGPHHVYRSGLEELEVTQGHWPGGYQTKGENRGDEAGLEPENRFLGYSGPLFLRIVHPY
jgi:hypothetical protein